MWHIRTPGGHPTAAGSSVAMQSDAQWRICTVLLHRLGKEPVHSRCVAMMTTRWAPPLIVCGFRTFASLSFGTILILDEALKQPAWYLSYAILLAYRDAYLWSESDAQLLIIIIILVGIPSERVCLSTDNGTPIKDSSSVRKCCEFVELHSNVLLPGFVVLSYRVIAAGGGECDN